MHIQAAKFLKEVADEIGIEAEIYEDYSGRGMYGGTTTGIVTESAIALLGAAISWVLVDYSESEVPDGSFSALKVDSMGVREILY